MHGHWAGKRGAVHYNNGFNANGYTDNLDNWICCIGKSGGTTPGNVLLNGQAVGVSTLGNGGYTLGINNGMYPGEYSDFGLIVLWFGILL